MRTKISLPVAASMLLFAALGCTQDAGSVVTELVIPDSPDGTVIAVAKALRDNHPEVLWRALPESYRQGLTEITRSFAEKMDPAVYDRAFALFMRTIEVLDDRKDVILASQTFASTGIDGDEIRDSLRRSKTFTETLKASQIATLEGLGTVDWEQFLATTGATMLEDASTIESAADRTPLYDLDSLAVETLNLSEDRATLKISLSDHEPEEVEMVRVEGRWVPAEMAEEWPQFVEDARAGLAVMTPENMAAQKTQIMMLLGMAEGFIEQIATLETPDEFDAAIGPMLAPFLGGGMTDMGEDVDWTAPEEEPDEE